MSVPEKIPLSELSRGDLEALTERLLAENAALKQMVADLRAGIVRLKGVTGGPAIRPSGMEQKTEPKPTDTTGKRGTNQSKTGHEGEARHQGQRGRASRATRTSSSRIWCCARMSAGRAGSRPTGTRADAGWGCRPLWA